VATEQRPGLRFAVPATCVAAVLAIGAASWAILEGEFRLGGWGALVGALLIVAASLSLSRFGGRRERLEVALVDRVFDGAILGSVAWATRSSAPEVAAGALLAMATGFLAAYVRARGSALAYPIEDSPATRAIRCGAISIALIAGWTSWAFYALTVWLLLVVGVRASQVAKEERL
jgi:hypothetical protein